MANTLEINITGITELTAAIREYTELLKTMSGNHVAQKPSTAAVEAVAESTATAQPADAPKKRGRKAAAPATESIEETAVEEAPASTRQRS
jgi:hypothetical protein